jgi:NYN domain
MSATGQVALFIDAENVSASCAEELFAFCEGMGRLTIARCYGKAEKLSDWEAASAGHCVVPVATAAWTPKSNASDFALVIDAVRLSLAHGFEHAVIASSDADFTQLAIFLRERGILAFLAGEEVKAAPELRRAFYGFHGLRMCGHKKSADLVLTENSHADPLDKAFQSLVNENGTVPMSALGKKLQEFDSTYVPGNGRLSRRLQSSGKYEFNGGTARRNPEMPNAAWICGWV